MHKLSLNEHEPCGILIAADYNAPQSGNFIASLIDLAEAAKTQGDQVAFLFPKQREDSLWVNWIEKKGFPLFFADKNSANEDILSVVRGIIIKYGIRLIHLHFGYLESVLLPTHKELGVELVIHDHFDFVTSLGQLRQRASIVRKALLYRRNNVFCISVMKKKDRWYRLAGKKRHCFIANGLSLHRALQDDLSVEERRKEIGVQEGEKLVLFLGWDYYRKGLDVAIKAVEIYRKIDPRLKIGVIGVGTDGKPNERAEAFLIERGIDPLTEAILYMHSYEDIFALNRAVDCYISSSRAEAFSYGILEAISQNTPVVVSDIVGTSWCWKYGNCFRYPVEDPDACAEAIGRALTRGRAESNYRDYIQEYGNDVWTKEVLSVYQKMLH